VVEGENEDEDDKENVNSSKPTNGKPDKKQAKQAPKDSANEGEDDDSEDDSDFSAFDIEAKEVVVGCFTPTVRPSVIVSFLSLSRIFPILT
jgi:hypothetical protein